MDNERSIERYFVTQVRAAGGWPVKLSCPGTAGMPDRVVFWPRGVISFVELKRDRVLGHLSEIQKQQIRKLQKRAVDVRVLWGKEDVDKYIRMYKPFDFDRIDFDRMNRGDDWW